VVRVGDQIELLGLRGFGRHGVFPEERANGQEFIVDLALSVDTARAAISDDLADTVDYGALALAVIAVIEGEPVDLLETLAQRIVEVALAAPLATAVTVRVHKPQAPLTVSFADVVVTVTRTR